MAASLLLQIIWKVVSNCIVSCFFETRTNVVITFIFLIKIPKRSSYQDFLSGILFRSSKMFNCVNLYIQPFRDIICLTRSVNYFISMFIKYASHNAVNIFLDFYYDILSVLCCKLLTVTLKFISKEKTRFKRFSKAAK